MPECYPINSFGHTLNPRLNRGVSIPSHSEVRKPRLSPTPPPCMGWTHRLQTFGDIGNTFCILMAAFLKRRQPWDGRKLPLCLNELNLLHWLCRKAYVFLSFVVVLG